MRTTQEIALVSLHVLARKWLNVFGMLKDRHVQLSDRELPSTDTAM
jgi:hypothetical protein